MEVKILIVEDDVVTQERIAKQLEIMGYKVSAKVETGNAALEAINELMPDLILLDIELKGEMDGIKVAEVIYSNWQLPVIFISAYSDSNTVIKAAQTYPAYFLSKPYTIPNLTVAINFALGKIILKDDKSNQILAKGNAIFIKKKNAYVKILVDEILWIQSSGSSIIIFLDNDKKYIVTANLKTFLAQFNHPTLIRVHRSYLINKAKVEEINGRRLLIRNELIPFSDQYQNIVSRHFPIIKSRKPK